MCTFITALATVFFFNTVSGGNGLASLIYNNTMLYVKDYSFLLLFPINMTGGPVGTVTYRKYSPGNVINIKGHSRHLHIF